MSYISRLIDQFFKKDKEPDAMKYLIAGLGNTGAEYENTRHNMGFAVVDALAREFGVPFKTETFGDVAKFKHKGRTFVLLKPATFMNRSGKAIRYWMQKEKLPKDKLLVVVDDVNLPFGQLRLRGKGSPGGHNGLKSIDQETGGGDYARLRIGIGDDFSRGRQVDFVLGEWSDAEVEKLPDILTRSSDAVKSFATIGLQHTMNAFNG